MDIFFLKKKDERYLIHPTENIPLRLRDPPNALRTHYHLQKETEIRKNQKVMRECNNELIVKNYPKNNQPIVQQLKFKPPNCPSWKRRS